MKTRTKLFTLFGVAIALCFASATQAQDKKPRPKIVAFGSDSPERGTTRVGYWNNEKNQGAGQFAIDYGRPVWRKEYEDTANFDKMTKGKVYRLRSNYSKTLDNDIPPAVAGQKNSAGGGVFRLRHS